jgi:endonuclease YncB( thermonuclease family)
LGQIVCSRYNEKEDIKSEGKLMSFLNRQTESWLLFWALGLLLIFLVSCNQANDDLNRSNEGADPGAALELPTSAPTSQPTPANTRVLPLDSLTPEPTPTITPIPDEVLGLVVQVIDGDTIAVVMEGDPPAMAYEVRYIGVDTPPNNRTNPWGVVAYETNRKMTGLKVVRLVRDETELDADGRLLRYVYVDNQLMSIILAEQGLAEATDVGQNSKFETEIAQAETQAREANLGLWSNVAPTPTATRAPTDAEVTDEPDQTTTPGPAETPATPRDGSATPEPDQTPDEADELTPAPEESVVPTPATPEATEEADETPTRTPTATPESTSE